MLYSPHLESIVTPFPQIYDHTNVIQISCILVTCSILFENTPKNVWETLLASFMLKYHVPLILLPDRAWRRWNCSHGRASPLSLLTDADDDDIRTRPSIWIFLRVRQSGLRMVDTCFTGKTGEVEALKNSSKKTIWNPSPSPWSPDLCTDCLFDSRTKLVAH